MFNIQPRKPALDFSPLTKEEFYVLWAYCSLIEFYTKRQEAIDTSPGAIEAAIKVLRGPHLNCKKINSIVNALAQKDQALIAWTDDASLPVLTQNGSILCNRIVKTNKLIDCFPFTKDEFYVLWAVCAMEDKSKKTITLSPVHSNHSLFLFTRDASAKILSLGGPRLPEPKIGAILNELVNQDYIIRGLSTAEESSGNMGTHHRAFFYPATPEIRALCDDIIKRNGLDIPSPSTSPSVSVRE